MTPGAAPELRFDTSRALSAGELGAVERLEEACIAADGGRLKLEFRTLHNRSGDRPSDFTCWVADELVGFLGLYQWRAGEIELTGMVHPAYRRMGIWSRLYAEATEEVRRRAVPRLLLVMDREWQPAHRFAESRGARYDGSEHRMVQLKAPPRRSRAHAVVVRPARDEEACFVKDCLVEAFKMPRESFELESTEALLDDTLVVELDSELVGTLRVDRRPTREAGGAPESAGIYGFAVLPSRQGKGIGRQVLLDVTESLRAEGVERITLEVAVENDSALHLYESCGFERVATEDYWLVEPLGAEQVVHPSAGL